MATFTVTKIEDAVNAGDGVLSLREALNAANATMAADMINFSCAVQGQTIILAGSQLTASADVTIDGGTDVTIDGDVKSQVLLVQGDTGIDRTEVTLADLTVTGGKTVADFEAGGDIRADFYTALTLDHETVSGNSTAGYRAIGGGIYGDSVTLTESTVSVNSTEGDFAEGGGIRSNNLNLTNNTESGNNTISAKTSGGCNTH